MKVIGLTGGIASGKSTVSDMLKELGASIIDVDLIARQIVKKGEKAYNEIVENYTEKVLLPSGELNRKMLGDIVFSDPEKLRLLNSITHPEIINRIKEDIARLKEEKVKLIVLDAAILIEMNLQKLVDEVWLVTVDVETQIKRLVERDRFSLTDAANRVNSQFPNEKKLKYADVQIDNNAPIQEVRERIKELWNNTVLGEKNS